MRRKYIVPVILCLALLISGCEIIMQPSSTNAPVPATQALQITQVPLETLAPEITQLPLATLVPTATVMPVITPSPEPTPNNTMSFYSCYAEMVSYNPANSWASFDYFYLLQGQDAIDYLVDHEGYSQTDAENLVNDFADSEFINQNNNSGLRTIDLDTVPIKMMFYPNGTMVTGAISISATVADVNTLYSLGPQYVLDYFFYYVHCDSNGNVTAVEQIYWP